MWIFIEKEIEKDCGWYIDKGLEWIEKQLLEKIDVNSE